MVVEQLVVNEGCAERQDAVAQRAQLVVLGRPVRGTLLNGLAVSPAIALAAPRRAPW
jgi:hypothetical protein